MRARLQTLTLTLTLALTPTLTLTLALTLALALALALALTLTCAGGRAQAVPSAGYPPMLPGYHPFQVAAHRRAQQLASQLQQSFKNAPVIPLEWRPAHIEANPNPTLP